MINLLRKPYRPILSGTLKGAEWELTVHGSAHIKPYKIMIMSPIIYFSYAFCLSEILLAIIKRSKSRSVKNRGDKGSLIFLWSMITLGFISGFFLSKPAGGFWEGFGFPLVVVGFIIRWASILQLGKSFTVDVAIVDKAALKTDGIYSRVRHPSYSGLLMIVCGFAALMNSVFSFLVLAVPVFIALLYRINIEEKLLSAEFGDSYSEYKKETKKLIPGIF
jgi:protein-S-isoprenylcysteine O-methyltransferase Ste14